MVLSCQKHTKLQHFTGLYAIKKIGTYSRGRLYSTLSTQQKML